MTLELVPENPLTTAQLDELRRLGDELRGLFARERRAIATLDHAQLTLLAEQKRAVSEQLAATHRAAGGGRLPRDLRDLFTAVQAEARANQMLANTAAEAVRALLGYEAPANSYDRRARKLAARPAMRTLMTY